MEIEKKIYTIDVLKNQIKPNDRMYLLSVVWSFDPSAIYDGSQIIYSALPEVSANFFAELRSSGSTITAENPTTKEAL